MQSNGGRNNVQCAQIEIKVGKMWTIFLATKSARRILWFVLKLEMAFSTIVTDAEKTKKRKCFCCSSLHIYRLGWCQELKTKWIFRPNCGGHKLSFDWARAEIMQTEFVLCILWKAEKIREKCHEALSFGKGPCYFHFYFLWKKSFIRRASKNNKNHHFKLIRWSECNFVREIKTSWFQEKNGC